MQESKDYLILQQLKDDFENNFNDVEDRYNIMNIRVGDYIYEDMHDYPSISINGYSTNLDTEHKVMGGSYYKELMINLDMYMNYDSGIDNWDEIYKFREQVENFLLGTGNTFRTGISIGEEQLTYISPQENLAQARIEFSIIYKDIN
jgi:hypothetical protein